MKNYHLGVASSLNSPSCPVVTAAKHSVAEGTHLFYDEQGELVAAYPTMYTCITKVSHIQSETSIERMYYIKIPKARDIHTVEEWEKVSIKNIIIGNGYWAKDGFMSNDSVFSTRPLDATHVIWFNN
jgi:hypothetical protein